MTIGIMWQSAQLDYNVLYAWGDLIHIRMQNDM